jgi:hypothetical protein
VKMKSNSRDKAVGGYPHSRVGLQSANLHRSPTTLTDGTMNICDRRPGVAKDQLEDIVGYVI